MGKVWRRWRLWILALVVVGGAGAGLWFGVPPAEYRIRISRETTYYTAPLRPDGTVDYLAIVNAKLSEGVTPQNNTFGLLAAAFGPGWDHEEGYINKCLASLGLPPLAQEGQYLIVWSDFVGQRPPAAGQEGDDMPLSPRQAMWGQLDEAMTRPWRKEEFPLLAEFLQTNASPLALVTQATQRPRYYAPRLPRGDDDRLCTTWRPTPAPFRDAAKYLVARAMNRLAKGDIKGAWADQMTCHRLALLLTQDETLIGLLVAVAMESLAHAGDVALASSGKLTCEPAIAMARDLQGLGELPDLRLVLVQAERLCALDVVAICPTEALPPGLLAMMGDVKVEEGKYPRRSETSIDWNKALVALNTHFDRCEQALAQPRYADRVAAMRQIEDDLTVVRERLEESEGSPFSEVLEWLGISTDRKPSLRTWRARIARDPGAYILCMLSRSLTHVEPIRQTAVVRRQLAVTAFALAAYKAKNGGYPDALVALSPDYLNEVPLDGFSDAPLIYKRAGGGYLLYSVGLNMTDDGGKDSDREPGDLVVDVKYPRELRVGPEELW